MSIAVRSLPGKASLARASQVLAMFKWRSLPKWRSPTSRYAAHSCASLLDGQWTMVSLHVEPVGFHRTADGAIIAEVRLSVSDLGGKPIRARRVGRRTRRSDTFYGFRTARDSSTYRMLPWHRAVCLRSEVGNADRSLGWILLAPAVAMPGNRLRLPATLPT